jgi:zinc protease
MVTARVPSGNLANALAAAANVVSCQEVREEGFMYLPRTLEQASKRFQRLRRRPEFLAGEKLDAALYPGHPYGLRDYIDPITLKNVSAGDAQGFVKSHYRPENGLGVVHGDIDVAEAKSLTERYLGKWERGAPGGAMSPLPVPPGPSARRILLLDRAEATQALVSVGCRLAPPSPERMAAYDVLEAAAGELAWKLREERGATYGVHAGVQAFPGGAAHLMLSGAIETQQAGKSVALLLGIVSDLGTGTVDEGLFNVKRWDVGRGFMLRFASAAGVAGGILDAANLGFSPEVWDRYPEALAGTTRETIKEIMAPCLNKEIVAIVGDAKVLRPQLEKEGLKLE